jgi:hypothetical protein
MDSVQKKFKRKTFPNDSIISQWIEFEVWIAKVFGRKSEGFRNCFAWNSGYLATWWLLYHSFASTATEPRSEQRRVCASEILQGWHIREPWSWLERVGEWNRGNMVWNSWVPKCGVSALGVCGGHILLERMGYGCRLCYLASPPVWFRCALFLVGSSWRCFVAEFVPRHLLMFTIS